jgi:riboflavin synthase
MFTGIIQEIGNIMEIDSNELDKQIIFKTEKKFLDDMNIGDSLSINGVCLSVVETKDDTFSVDVSNETIKLTTFSDLKVNSTVNLEKAMTLSEKINGHFVSGHVDETGIVKEKKIIGRSTFFLIEAPSDIKKFFSKKGSISIDGVSLTINFVKENCFGVNIIPHTLLRTIMSDYDVGTRVNIEVDLIARYLETLLIK